MSVRLLPATATHLEAYVRDPGELAELLGTSLPEGWPEFPQAISFTLDLLRQRPDEGEWWMYFFLDSASGDLVGSGGYKGAPVDGAVEIGYEIAPGFRRRGLGGAAADALVARAFQHGEVTRVTAHTLAGDAASGGVLRNAGFSVDARIEDPEHGAVERWVRTRAE
ncbi:hypothetical protein GCM10010517_80290 [Streptosporangium fragile]|uniref:N-acetyltransferase domain-containing protein n=1 Tax=Streptosporangium fragile TaxID=46186 RepID=A0ABP6IY96_9ACTN